MAEKNSLWKNIRNKAKKNRESGATPKQPTDEMLRQERKIKAKQYAEGSFVGEDEKLPIYNYANKEGVVGGPTQVDGGTRVPVGPDGLPIVNMPEFEVISTGLGSKPNPYSPVTGEEYLSSSYNPVNLFLPPQVEKQQQPIDPKTGMPLPQSGRADYDYATEMMLALPAANAVKKGSALLKNAKQEIIYNAIDPVGYGVREKLGNIPQNLVRNTFKPNERIARVGKELSPLDLPGSEVVKSRGKARLDSWRMGLGLDQKYNTFNKIGDNLYSTNTPNPIEGRLSHLYNDIQANKINKTLGGDEAVAALRKLTRTHNSLTASKGPLNNVNAIREHLRKSGDLTFMPWEQSRIVEKARNPKFTHSVYDADPNGIMGQHRFDVTDLPDDNIHFQANDTWDLHPFSERGVINVGQKTAGEEGLKGIINNRLKNIEALKVLGGKPFNIQDNFIVNPNTMEVVKRFDSGGFYPTQGPGKALFKGYAQGGYTNPYNQYQDDPYLNYAGGGYTMYAGGGRGWKKFGNTMADIGLGIGDVALGSIGSVTGIKSLQDTIGTDQYHNDDFDTGANFVGKLAGTALKYIPVTAPFAQAAGVVGGVANTAFGIDRKNYDPSKHQSDLDKAGDIVNFAGNVGTMFVNPSGAAKEGAAAAKSIYGATDVATKAGQVGKVVDTASTISEAAATTAQAANTASNIAETAQAASNIGEVVQQANTVANVGQNVGKAVTAAAPVVDSANKLSSGLKYGEGYYNAVEAANKISKYGSAAQNIASVAQPMMQQQQQVQQQKQQKELAETSVSTEPMYSKPDANTPYAGIVPPTITTGISDPSAYTFGYTTPTNNFYMSQGGNITNNSLNLRNTMRYKRFAQGGTLEQQGINFITKKAGLHHQNANGGVPIGPGALAEGGEAKLQMADGGQYIVSDQVDGANTQTINGQTMAERLKKKLKPFMMGGLASNPKDKEELRRPFDSYSAESIAQVNQETIQENEAVRMQRGGAVQYAANGGKLNKDIEKIVMEEYTAAYGGVLPNKYKGKVNMPNSYAKGGNIQQAAKQILASKGGYVHNPMTQPMYAQGGPIYGDPASEYTYAYGGMYGNPYARGGQIDYTNDMYSLYAGGGPMVSNVNQPFNGPAAQNRGGMYMTYADGGMMPSEEQMMQEQQMQQQGGQDQMMQMVQQIIEALMQGANPEQIMQQLVQSGVPQEQAQQIIQVAMQEVQSQQQQQPQGQPMQEGQQMPPQQGMSTGGRLPKDILRARAEAHMSPEKAANYVDNYSTGGKMYYEGGPDGPPYNPINPMVNSNSYIQDQYGLEDLYGGVDDGSHSMFTTDEYGNVVRNSYRPTYNMNNLNRLESNYFDNSNSYNPNPYLPNNELGSMAPTSSFRPEAMPYDDEIDYTKMPYDKPLNLTGFKTPKPADKIPGPIGPNTIGPNGPITEAKAIEQGWKPEQPTTTTTTTTPPTKNGLSTSDWMDLGTGALSLAGPAYQFFQPKPEPFKYQKAKATTLDPTTAIVLANQASREAQSLADYNIKQNAPTSGSYLANIRANALQSGLGRGRTGAGIRQQYDINNAGILNQMEQYNTEIENRNIDAIQQDLANFQEQRTNALYNAGANLAGMRRDYKGNQINEMIAKNLGTANFKYDPVTETFKYPGPDGQMITVPAATVLGTNSTNLGTGEMQQTGTPQFKRNNFADATQNAFRKANTQKRS